MDDGSIGLIVALVAMVCMSAFFSASETAFSSLSRTRLKTLAKEGNKRAGLTLKLADNFDELLSTILIGNNVVNISSATMATILFMSFFADNGATVSTVVMTVVVLIFGEITPKSIAKENPEQFAMAVAPIYRVLLVAVKPINFLLLQLKSGIKKLVGSKQSNTTMTEGELLTIVDEVEKFNKDESDLIKNAIEFNDVDVIEVFTPRIDVCAIELETSVEDIAQRFKDTGYSRIPVYQTSIDMIVGIIYQKDFHYNIVGKEATIESIIKPVEYIVSTTKISALLKIFQKSKTHFAVIVDEHGGTAGIVTLEDVLEELVGEIWDEHDETVDYFKQNEQGAFIVSTAASLDDFFEQFALEFDTDATTINGWIIENLSKVPEQGDTFTVNEFTVTVAESVNRKATEIHLVKKESGLIKA